MLALDDVSRARRLAGAAALALLCAATAAAAWASQPAQVQIAMAQAAVQPAAIQALSIPRTGAAVPTETPSDAQAAIPDAPAFVPARPIQLAQAKATPPAATPTPDQVATMLAEQQAPRHPVPFDPAHFDKFVGYYQATSSLVFKITRDGDKFFTQLTGQEPVQVYPESETKFFATVVAAQISFNTDAQGRVTELVLHQNGREIHAPRIDQATATTAEAALAQRVKDQTPAPGSKAALTRLLDGLVNGQPPLDILPPLLARDAQNVRIPQPPGMPGNPLQAAANMVAERGGAKSLTFVGVMPQGGDLYEATLGDGSVQRFFVTMGADGKIAGFGMQGPPASAASQAALTRHKKDTAPSPGTEASLRRYIDSLEKGQPDYDDMTAALAMAVRSQLPMIQGLVMRWGPLKSITFRQVNAQGYDVFDVAFEHGQAVWYCGPLTPNGKADARAFSAAP